MGDGAHELFVVYHGGGDVLRKASLCCEVSSLCLFVDQPSYRRDGREGHDEGEQEILQGIRVEVPCYVVGLCM